MARAAGKNHAEAQHSLGVILSQGKGVAPDHARAYAWFNLAAAQGHEKARVARDYLAESMSPEEVRKAQDISKKLYDQINSQ
jgi:TPR repeat protein